MESLFAHNTCKNMEKKSILYESSDSEEVDFKVNESYATNYNNWREKEELQKLKSRYGEDVDLSSSSSSESENEEELAGVFDKQFLKTLSSLKSKAPEIYDKNVNFFTSTDVEKSKTAPKVKKTKSMFLKDYERKIILEKDGILTDEDDDEAQERPVSPSYMQEQAEIIKSFKNALEDSESEDDLLKEKSKTQEDEKIEEEEYLKWIKGKETNPKDKSTTKELSYLKNYWNNPKLDESEAFLRDYILNRNYIDNENKNPENEDEGELSTSEDEKLLEQQEDFEHKFNFRFEEPDEDFIKRFPRTMCNTLRRKDSKRQQQREEYRERKKEEKDKKKEELKRLKALKRKQISQKLEQLKEITGNQKLGFDDLEEDFDPEKYDNRMKEIFNEEYYGVGENDDKPVFPFDDDIDGDENWDSWKGNFNEAADGNNEGNVHCEDPNFNMDADYDPQKDLKTEMVNASKKSKRKQSKFAEVLSNKKPVFDPSDKTYEEYLDEYYKLDFEDIIGDLPVRFPYRNTVPNDFGLSVDEILTAHDKELNQWCSLKKTCQHRTEQEEKYDVQAFQKKAENENLKKKVLPSLFKDNEDDTETSIPKRKRKRKGKNKNAQNGDTTSKVSKFDLTPKNVKKVNEPENGVKRVMGGKVKKSKKQTDGNEMINGLRLSDERLKAYGINPKKFKNKLKYKK